MTDQPGQSLQEFSYKKSVTEGPNGYYSRLGICFVCGRSGFNNQHLIWSKACQEWFLNAEPGVALVSTRSSTKTKQKSVLDLWCFSWQGPWCLRVRAVRYKKRQVEGPPTFLTVSLELMAALTKHSQAWVLVDLQEHLTQPPFQHQASHFVQDIQLHPALQP